MAAEGRALPDQEARCQHCPCLADERSFMCSDCASEADFEVQTLRDENERLRETLKHIAEADVALFTGKPQRPSGEYCVDAAKRALASDEPQAPPQTKCCGVDDAWLQPCADCPDQPARPSRETEQTK